MENTVAIKMMSPMLNLEPNLPEKDGQPLGLTLGGNGQLGSVVACWARRWRQGRV